MLIPLKENRRQSCFHICTQASNTNFLVQAEYKASNIGEVYIALFSLFVVVTQASAKAGATICQKN